jgi:hypothetical protein
LFVTLESRRCEVEDDAMIELRKNGLVLAAIAATAVVFFFLGFLFNQRRAIESEADSIFAKTKSITIYGRDVLPKVQEQIVQHEKEIYRLKRNATEELILAKSAGLEDPGDSVASKGAVPDSELLAWAAERGLRLGPLTGKQREDLVANYRIQKRQLEESANRDKLLKQAGVDWLLPVAYRRSVVDAEPGRLMLFKAEAAKNQVILFANFHCGRCARLAAKMRELVASSAADISISLRFSVNPGDAPIVSQTARGAFCAAEQSKFLEYFEAASNHPPVDGQALRALVSDLKIDTSKFETCVADPKTEATLQKDVSAASRIGSSGLPVAVVKGHLIPLQEPIEEYLRLLGH